MSITDTQGPSSDHQYQVFATIAHPHPPCQYLPIIIVAGSSAVYPTAQRSDPIRVGSASVDLTRPDHIVVGCSDGCWVSEQSMYRMPQPPLQLPPGHAYAVPPQLHSAASTSIYSSGYPNPSDPAIGSGNMVPTVLNPNTVQKYDVRSD